MYQIGMHYSRRDDIHSVFNGQQQGGISTPSDAPYVFLFTGDAGEQFGYEDGWQAGQGVYLYTGEGQKGNMEFVRGNRAIRDHVSAGKDLLLFKALGKSKPVEFIGSFICASWSYISSPDVDGEVRQAIQYHLIPNDLIDVGLVERSGGPASDNPAPVLPLADLRKKAYSAVSPSKDTVWRNARQRARQRNSDIRNYVLARANGKCELTGEAAPFLKKDGTPFLEVHHLTKVSDNGLDDPCNCAAITPNVHREIHLGQNGNEMNERLLEIIRSAEKT